MIISVLNILVAVAMGAIVLAQQTGIFAPGDAFFAAVALLALYTAYHINARQGMPLGNALRMLLLEPRSHGGQTAYLAYLVSASLAGLVIVQAVLSA